MNALSRALLEHRRRHPGCRGCTAYLDIARRAVAARQRWQGSTAPCVVLSVREAP